MAITTVGFDDADITEAGFSKLMQYAGECAFKHGVPSGLAVTPGPATRQVSISAGVGLFPGLLAESGAVETLTLAANSSGSTRTDYIVLAADWSANTVTPAVVQGTSSAAPVLTQTAGVLWHLPLARVPVPNGYASTFTSGHITTCKPLPRQSYRFAGTVSTSTIAYNNSGTVVSSITVPDPGWSYRLRLTAAARFSETSTGYALIRAMVDGSLQGTSLSPRLNLGGLSPATLTATSATLTGSVIAQLVAEPASMSSGSSLVVASSAMNSFVVEQIPA